MKEGDSVVCIDNSVDGLRRLTIGKVYIIKKIINVSTIEGRNYRIVGDGGLEVGYFARRFCSLVEYRKMKLDRLNSISK